MSNFENEYTGWVKWTPTIEEWANFSVSPYVPFEMYENQYLLVYRDEDGKKKLTSQYQYAQGKLRKVGRGSISISFSDFKLDENGVVKETKTTKKKTRVITPINDEQIAAVDLLNNNAITFKMISGNFGSGKTLLTSVKAVEMLIRHDVEKIIWLRNMVGVKNAGSLGFLPGTLLEKVRPWIAPLIDNLQSEAAVLHMIQKRFPSI